MPTTRTQLPPAGGGSTGPAVDRTGTPVIDPTENVIALTQAESKRQDDLRAASDRFNQSEIQHVKELAALRSEFIKQLAEAEAKRIDAIRAVDVNAVAVASERQAAAATVLANQVAQSADALRTLVATTASATAEQSRQQLTQITDRLSVVEKSQYEGRGKESYTDPMLLELTSEMKRLGSVISINNGRSAANKDYTAYIVAAIGIILALVSYFRPS